MRLRRVREAYEIMTPSDFRAALADLGLSQAGFARFAMVDARTVRRWCDGTRAVPGPVVALLGMMDKQRLTAPLFICRGTVFCISAPGAPQGCRVFS
jgi:DNA-binding transcriptional regulator YiaG